MQLELLLRSYAVGGWDGTNRLMDVERYDPRTNAWSSVTSMKLALTSPAIAACQGKLYVCGGAILEDGDGIDMVQVRCKKCCGVHL